MSKLTLQNVHRVADAAFETYSHFEACEGQVEAEVQFPTCKVAVTITPSDFVPNELHCDLPTETLQRLIDFAHAAMSKREGIEDEAVVTQSRRSAGCAELLAIDLRAIQKIGRPSWETEQTTPIVES